MKDEKMEWYTPGGGPKASVTNCNDQTNTDIANQENDATQAKSDGLVCNCLKCLMKKRKLGNFNED
jgi:hypothetical protein